MARKCCVPGCKSNYDPRKKKKKVETTDNVSVNEGKENNTVERMEVDEPTEKIHVPTFRLPSSMDEKLRWLAAIPKIKKEKILKQKCPVVCIRHWPTDFDTITVHGKVRPVYPPSVFDGVPRSEIPTPPPKPRPTKKSTFEARTTKVDELDAFLKQDRVEWNDIRNLSAHTDRFEVPVTTFSGSSGEQWVLSNEYISGIPRFSFKIRPDLTYEAYRIGVKCTVTSLSRNRINKLSAWSRISEVVHFLQNKEESRHEKVLKEQVKSMEPPTVGKKFYDPETIARAFEYFASSRSRFRKDFKLPSEKSMTSLTSKVSKISDGDFIKNVFKNLDDRQKKVTIMIDEVYAKAALLYRGGSL